MDTQYQPINCSLYDYLEMWAVQQKLVDVIFIENQQQKTFSNVIIKDLKTINKEEFVFLNNGQSLRLDQLIRINEIDFTRQSC